MRTDNLRVSDCCGAPPKGNGDCDTEDFGICPACSKEFIQSKYLGLRKKFCSRNCSYLSEDRNKRISESKVANKNPMWKGDKVGYPALHNWVINRLTKPTTCSCCGLKKRLDLANISNEYKRDLSDWEWLCRKCHMTKDGRLERFNTHNAIRKIGDIVCGTCSVLFEAKGSTTRFCSKSCAAIYQQAKLRIKNNRHEKFNHT